MKLGDFTENVLSQRTGDHGEEPLPCNLDRNPDISHRATNYMIIIKPRCKYTGLCLERLCRV